MSQEIFYLNCVGSRHRFDLKFRHHHRTEECRCILSDFSLRQIHDEYLPIIHDPPEGEWILRLSEYIAEYRGREELSDLVEDRIRDMRGVLSRSDSELLVLFHSEDSGPRAYRQSYDIIILMDESLVKLVRGGQIHARTAQTVMRDMSKLGI